VATTGTKAFQNSIGGDWVDAQSGETFESVSPATGEVLGTFLLILFGCGAVHVAVLTGALQLWQIAMVWAVAIMIAGLPAELRAKSIVILQSCAPLRESVEPRANVDAVVRYGYFWWLASSGVGDASTPWIGAFGNGGQRLFVLPELELIVVVTAGNYNQPENWRTPTAVLTQFVLPALAAGPRE